MVEGGTSFVAVRALADMAGFPWGSGHSGWSGSTETATFADGLGNTIVVSMANPNVAIVNNVPHPLVDTAGRPAPAFLRDGQMFVPFGFFNDVDFFPLTVRWVGGGVNEVHVSPR